MSDGNSSKNEGGGVEEFKEEEAVRIQSEEPSAETKSQKRRIYKNVFLVSVSFLLLFVAGMRGGGQPGLRAHHFFSRDF